jgi:hypothetical protein
MDKRYIGLIDNICTCTNIRTISFRGFRGSFKPRKLKSNEIQFSHSLLPVVFETQKSRIHGSM